MRDVFEVEKRRREILAAIIHRYIATGEPVGSKAVVEQLPQRLSSATIRHVMAELEREGLLGQPHVSAGRIPTDMAYRFYVDRIVGSTRLAPTTEKYIEETLCAESTEPAQLMAKASRVLSEVSENVGLVLGPALEEKVLEHIKFVKLPGGRVLAVIVSRPALVESRVVRLEEDFPQAELDQTADYLNSEFLGWSLRTIRLEVFMRMEEEKALCDRLFKNIATLFMWGALADEELGPIFVDGTAKTLSRPEFEDVRRILELLVTLEEKARLVKILSGCLQVSSPGVRILIGHENPASEMQRCTVVMAPLHYHERAVGALGVVGPTRMEYARAITAVDFVAHLCSRLLSSN